MIVPQKVTRIRQAFILTTLPTDTTYSLNYVLIRAGSDHTASHRELNPMPKRPRLQSAAGLLVFFT